MRVTPFSGGTDMTDDGQVMIVTERFERRLAEESGKLRVDMASGFGRLEARIESRNADLLKWLLVFATTQTAAIAALLTLLR
ncbi:MAG: hypothetical protein K2Y23_09600 [Cyanobacteria bacterium]|nr:hypothetical protein [Cyanobacteriota bacterium]